MQTGNWRPCLFFTKNCHTIVGTSYAFYDNQAILMNVIKLGYKPINIEFHKRYDDENIFTLANLLTASL